MIVLDFQTIVLKILRDRHGGAKKPLLGTKTGVEAAVGNTDAGCESKKVPGCLCGRVHRICDKIPHILIVSSICLTFGDFWVNFQIFAKSFGPRCPI